MLVLLPMMAGLVAWQKGWLHAALRAWDFYQQSAPIRQAMSHTFPSGTILWDRAAQPAIGVSLPQATPSNPFLQMTFPGETKLFVHGRKTKSGDERLVIICFVQPRSGHGEHLSTLLLKPGTLSSSPRHHGPDTGLDLPTPPEAPLRFYAGQADPSDDSHFTIEIDMPSGRSIVDGWLQDSPTKSPSWDPVEVKMEIRPCNNRK